MTKVSKNYVQILQKTNFAKNSRNPNNEILGKLKFSSLSSADGQGQACSSSTTPN